MVKSTIKILVRYTGYFAALVLCSFFYMGEVTAQIQMEPPIYNEETNSYFTLVKVGNPKTISSPTQSWLHMDRIARTLRFKGVQGRLAKISSKSVHELLRDNFAAKQETYAWFGLRYFCDYGKSMWIDGTVLKTTDYTNWSPAWDLTSDTACGGPTYNFFPAIYLSQKKGFLWGLHGWGKYFNEMYVEFVMKE